MLEIKIKDGIKRLEIVNGDWVSVYEWFLCVIKKLVVMYFREC